MNRIFTLTLTALLSLSLLTACAPTVGTTPDVDVPEVTQPDTPQVDTETDSQDEIPQVEVPDVDSDDVEAPTGDIALSSSDFTLFGMDESYQLTISNLLSSDVVTFSSSNNAVATVGEDGTVTAVAPGSATITATILVDGITSIDRTAIVRCTFEVETPETDGATPAVTLDFSAFYEELAQASEYQAGMMLGEGDMLLYSYPTMGDYDFAQVAVYMPMMSAVASELTLIEVKDATDVENAKAILQTRIDTQVDGGAWYPATIQGWVDNARIVVNGNFVMLVVAENADDVVAAFNAKF